MTPKAVSLLCFSLREARQEADAHRRPRDEIGRKLLRQLRRLETDTQTRALLTDPFPPRKPTLNVLRGVVGLLLTAERLARVLQFLEFPHLHRDFARATRQFQNLRVTRRKLFCSR